MFLQLLEGSSETIDEVFARIGRDPRHEGIRVLYDGSARERCVPSCGMGVLEIEDLDDDARERSPSDVLIERTLELPTLPDAIATALQARHAA